LVSTISFSGLERMDYPLAGNNVLKDHSCPTLTFLARAGILRNGALAAVNQDVVPAVETDTSSLSRGAA
jgi:hypothetical protein